MAFRDISLTADDPAFPSFYNLSMAVGDWAPNRKDDVMLVQFLLREVYKGPAFDPPLPKPEGEMKVDGIFGPITKRFLFTFQTDMRKRGGLLSADGRADRVRGFTSSISQTMYTVFFLNIKVNQVRDDFQELHLAKDIPQELAFQLF